MEPCFIFEAFELYQKHKIWNTFTKIFRIYIPVNHSEEWSWCNIIKILHSVFQTSKTKSSVSKSGSSVNVLGVGPTALLAKPVSAGKVMNYVMPSQLITNNIHEFCGAYLTVHFSYGSTSTTDSSAPHVVSQTCRVIPPSSNKRHCSSPCGCW
jgi:hypothetical protein